MDDEPEYRAVRPYGDWGGVFVLNRKIYRLYRIYKAALFAVMLIAGNWLLLYRARPAYAWPLFWVLVALAFYIQHRIVSSGKSRAANWQGSSDNASGYSVVGFWLAQIGGWFLIAFASLAIAGDFIFRGEIHAYEFPLLLIGAASVVGTFASRKRKAK